MILKVYKKHLTKAIIEMQEGEDTCHKCILAQAAKDLFKDDFDSVGTTIHLHGSKGRYEPSPIHYDLFVSIYHLFDHGKYDELRKMLPLKIELIHY